MVRGARGCLSRIQWFPSTNHRCVPMTRDRHPERVFFALWPPPAVRQQIAREAAELPLASAKRRLAVQNLHMTLHFIGSLAVARIDCMVEQARDITCRPFTLDLDQMGYFAKPGVVWMGCSQAPSPLIDLHAQLANRLGGCGYVAEKRPFQPHVTLARKVTRYRPTRCQPVAWSVDRFVLARTVNQQGGVRYVPRNWFEFAG